MTQVQFSTLNIIQEFFEENKQNLSNFDFDSGTELDKTSKVTSIEKKLVELDSEKTPT